MRIPFTKMHGCGNDYIYVNLMQHEVPNPYVASQVWSDRHKGIGSDGLVLIDRSPVPEADFSMRIFNADGSEAMMCGNASRCIGKYLYERGLTEKTEIRLLTLSGIKTLMLSLTPAPSFFASKASKLERPSEDRLPVAFPNGEGSGYLQSVESVTVDMGEPVFDDPSLFRPEKAESMFNSIKSESMFNSIKSESMFSSIKSESMFSSIKAESMFSSIKSESNHSPLPARGVGGEALFVSMGNPHYVIFTDEVDKVGEVGPVLEHHPAFPQRCNIELAQVRPDGTIRTRVWERGSGITMACGTGACATAVAAAVTGKAGRKSQIVMDGGILTIEWCEKDRTTEGHLFHENHVYMTGPAEFVFDGEITDQTT